MDIARSLMTYLHPDSQITNMHCNLTLADLVL